MNNQTLQDIIKLLLSKKRDIIYFCGIVFLGAVVISLLLPNEYKASTTFYAASDDLSRPEVMFGGAGERTYFYGGTNERDRLIQVSKSNRLFDKLMNKHDFFEHYEIKNDGNANRQKVLNKFHKNFEVVKNDLDALEMSFIDENPEFAAAVVNDARDELNDLVSSIIKSSQGNFIKTLEEKIIQANQTIDGLTNGISKIRDEYQFFDSQNQISQIAELVTASKNKLASEEARLELYRNMRGVRRDTLNNIRGRIAGLKSQIKTIENPDSSSARGLSIYELNNVLPELQLLEGRYYTIRGELVGNEVHVERLKLAQASNIPALHLVEEAELPAVKFKPRRSILVVGSVVAAFIFYILGILMYEGYKQTM